MVAPQLAAKRLVWTTLETGRMPGTSSAWIPAAAASSRNRKKQSGEKKNWVIARSAPASTLRFKLSRSAVREAESGGHPGETANEKLKSAIFFGPSPRPGALANPPESGAYGTPGWGGS